MRKLANLLRALFRISPDAPLTLLLPDAQDLLVFGGLAAVAYGVGQVYGPAGWVVGGAGCFWLGVRKA